MDGFLFVVLMGLSFGGFAAAHRSAGKAPYTALTLAVLAVLAGLVCTMAVVADPDGVRFVSEGRTVYEHTLAASMDVPAPPPAFEWTFDSAAGLDGWHQSNYVYKASNDDELSWSAEHGGSIKMVATTSRDDRFNGFYLASISREAGHEWATLAFDYRIVGEPGRHGLIVAWSCDACFASQSTTIVSADASTNDSGWQHAQVEIPITEKDLIVSWTPPLVAAVGGLYSERTVYLDNVVIRTAGLSLSNETAGVPVEHGASSAGRFVLTAETESVSIPLIAATDSNRAVAGGLFGAWSVYLLLYSIGLLPAVLWGRKA